MKELKGFTRREFLKKSSYAAIGGALYLNLAGTQKQTAGNRSRVVLIRDEALFDENNRLRAEIVQQMLDRGVMALTGKSTVESAWAGIAEPSDTVGIKTNVWNYLPTPPSLENSIKKRLIGRGIPEDRIGIRDRGLLDDPLFRNATALINVRPLRTHYWSGVGSLIKNYIMFVEKPYTYHPDTCADLAAIWKLPHVKGKTRLNILVMFTPLFHGVGPHHFNAKYTWQYNGLLLGFDPVAVDSTGVRILQKKRNLYFGEERPINPPPKHIFMADTRHHLGTADPAGIDLIKLGWMEDNLLD